jgi:hypothetical protein
MQHIKCKDDKIQISLLTQLGYLITQLGFFDS